MDSKRRGEKEYNGKQGNNTYGLEPPRRHSSYVHESQYSDRENKKGNSPKSVASSGRRSRTKSEIRHRQDKKRRLKKGVRNFITVVIAVLVIAGVGGVLSVTVFFKVDKVSVSGSGIYSEAEIVTASGIEQGDSMFLVNRSALARNMEERMPYVYSLKVKYALPSEIKLQITDAVVAYAIKNEDKTYILLDDNFKVLENESETKKGATLISVSGKISAVPGSTVIFEKESTMGCISEIMQAIDETNLKPVSKVESRGLTQNFIVYDSRITFKLGSCDDLNNKIYRGLAVCEKLDESNPGAKGTVDLTDEKQIYFTEK